MDSESNLELRVEKFLSIHFNTDKRQKAAVNERIKLDVSQSCLSNDERENLERDFFRLKNTFGQ
jgi:hypothetical protein